MPTFRNKLDHAIYATVNGKSVKLGAGKVASFTGETADAFAELVSQGYAEKLSAKDGEKAIADQQADQVDPTVTAEGRMPQTIASLVGRVGQMSVSAPLQVVVGDDLAPFGPPSGETTTKQALAQADPAGVDRRQFAENEVLVGDPKLAEPAVVAGSTTVSAAEAHESQRQARIGVEESIDALEIAGASTASLDGEDAEPAEDEQETPPPAE